MQWKLIIGTKAKSLGYSDDGHVEKLMMWQNIFKNQNIFFPCWKNLSNFIFNVNKIYLEYFCMFTFMLTYSQNNIHE
jgi:hypothetical protein